MCNVAISCFFPHHRLTKMYNLQDNILNEDNDRGTEKTNNGPFRPRNLEAAALQSCMMVKSFFTVCIYP